MALQILLGVVGTAAFAAWLYFVYHWLRALGHRGDDVPLSKLLMSGLAALDGGNFKESGQRHVRELKRGMLAFFACVFLLMLVAIVSS